MKVGKQGKTAGGKKHLEFDYRRWTKKEAGNNAPPISIRAAFKHVCSRIEALLRKWIGNGCVG